MSTNVPVTEAPIPVPDGTPAGDQKSIEAIKQHIEVASGVITPAQQAVTVSQKNITEAIYRVMHP
jgi:hypothetical protein